MFKKYLLATGLILTSFVPASATVAELVEVYSFSVGGWDRPGTTLTGSFRGVVEDNGLIGLNDLIDLHISGVDGGFTFSGGLGGKGLASFNYDTALGASSFNFAYRSFGATFCVGTDTGLNPICNPQDHPEALGFIGQTSTSTLDLPSVTLTDRFTTAPEPKTWVMLGLGFAAMAFMGYRRRNECLRASL